MSSGPGMSDRTSSAAGMQNSTSSSVPTQTQSRNKKAITGKKPIIVEMDGTVVGEFASNFSTRTGDIIRTIVPVHYKDWRQVPQNFRNNVWKNLMAEFELDIPPEVARPLLEKVWPQKFRSGKVPLRAHLKSGAEKPPDGMDPIIWEKFVENERDPKKKKQNLQNFENRKQLKYSHTLGRCTYGLKVHKKEEADPTQTYNNQTDKWLMGHEDKNGRVLESAKPFYDKIKEAKEKRTNEEVSGSTIENDELSEVFGKDPRGRVRGASSHITKKQMIQLGIANAKEKVNRVDKEGNNALKDELKSYVEEALKVQFQGFQFAIQGTMQSMMIDLNHNSPHLMTMPRSDFASNSVHDNLAQNLDNVFTQSPVERPNSSDKPLVILIDRENKELAKGYVVTDATAGICHGKKVGISEKKVYIDEVLEPDATLWFPQDGNDTLSAYVAGGYIIWFDSWLKYI